MASPKKSVSTANTLLSQTQQSAATPTQPVTILAVTPFEEDLTCLKAIFSHSNWLLYAAPSYEEALAFLGDYPIPVVISESDLPPYTWKDLLQQFARMPHPPCLIVTSRHADNQLWLEVLTLGGYDVLPKPFQPKEVFRVVSLAWQNWKDKKRQAGPVRLNRAAG